MESTSLEYRVLQPAPTMASISLGVLEAVRAAPWPYPKGQGHLGVKWKNGAEANKRVLDTAIARGDFTAAEALHRMTEGMINADGTPNGPRRPTLAAKWGPGGLACVHQPAHVVTAHVEALRQHLADTVAGQLLAMPAAHAPVDLTTSDSDDDEVPLPPPRDSAVDSDEAASLALVAQLQAESDTAFAAEVAGASTAIPPPAGAPKKRRTGELVIEAQGD